MLGSNGRGITVGVGRGVGGSAGTAKKCTEARVKRRYQVVKSESVRGLSELVNKEMVDGWKVAGGIAAVLETGTEILANPRAVYLQALVMEEEG
jgi:hypothetical protein